MTDDQLLTVAQAAARAGMTPGAWRALVSSGHVPPADDPGDMAAPANRRSPKWKVSTVDAYRGSRRVRRGRQEEAL
jgi:hypothetical protein